MDSGTANFSRHGGIKDFVLQPNFALHIFPSYSGRYSHLPTRVWIIQTQSVATFSGKRILTACLYTYRLTNSKTLSLLLLFLLCRLHSCLIILMALRVPPLLVMCEGLYLAHFLFILCAPIGGIQCSAVAPASYPEYVSIKCTKIDLCRLMGGRFFPGT